LIDVDHVPRSKVISADVRVPRFLPSIQNAEILRCCRVCGWESPFTLSIDNLPLSIPLDVVRIAAQHQAVSKLWFRLFCILNSARIVHSKKYLQENQFYCQIFSNAESLENEDK
jgi:hypothetical protein